jgi:hypothetical protein
MQTTKPTTTSLVYAAVISNPGITSRQIKQLLDKSHHGAINGALQNLTGRHAIRREDNLGNGLGRNGQYFKSNLPVSLRNATSSTPVSTLDRAAIKLELSQLQQQMAKLMATLG